jgi:DNA mismatch repair protein MSH4
MLIDYLSVRNLELVQNLQNPKSPQSLYGVLDHCHTPMGKRLLRANILQPSAGSSIEKCVDLDLNTLEARLDAVQEMIQTEDLYHGVGQGILPSYGAHLSFERIPGFRSTFNNGIPNIELLTTVTWSVE